MGVTRSSVVSQLSTAGWSPHSFTWGGEMSTAEARLEIAADRIEDWIADLRNHTPGTHAFDWLDAPRDRDKWSWENKQSAREFRIWHKNLVQSPLLASLRDLQVVEYLDPGTTRALTLRNLLRRVAQHYADDYKIGRIKFLPENCDILLHDAYPKRMNVPDFVLWHLDKARA